MAFITLTTFESNVRIAVNTENVTHIAANGARSKVYFASGEQLHVNETFDDVLILLPTYAVLAAIEETVEASTNDLPANPGEEAAASGAAADAANPAKSRQTK